MPALLTRRSSLVAIVVLALVVVILFGGRAAWRLGHRFAGPPPPPRQTDVSAIAGWMTVSYVGRAYRVPPPELFAALGVGPESHRTTTLDAIAAETGRTQDEMLDTVRRTVQTWQHDHPPPERGAPKPDDSGPNLPRSERPPA